MYTELTATVNWNLLDSLQSYWFQIRIKKAKKRGERVIYSALKARPSVIWKFQKAGCRVVNIESPVDEFTWISW